MTYIKMTLKWGQIVAGINDEAEIVGLWFVGQKYFPDIDEWTDRTLIIEEDTIRTPTDEIWPQVKNVVETLVKQLREYESGIRKEFDLPLNPEGTAFRLKVWKILQNIPYGETTTYGTIGQLVARQLEKKSMSAQAVGGAVGHNPISIIIPCHRVIGSNGELTGYAGGLDKKVKILKHEKKEV